MAFKKNYVYLYHGGSIDFDRYLKSKTAHLDIVSQVQMSLSVGYAASQAKKRAGNRLWQIRIPRTMYNTARYQDDITRHTTNPHMNYFVKVNWLASHSTQLQIRELDPYNALGDPNLEPENG